ncbi:DUF6151 family protein [Jannaschia sp. W003]|uniref:DUF6151 family protein n=1 Tax=Jannaschia sp. W003 TaxID=2867012 RepID=UPI0021A8007E|nr:DUF6151 family protein [Jannaschia sp. W003]UWQ20781.1 DUF6151 family protein [Jannaschia sp. W003]
MSAAARPLRCRCGAVRGSLDTGPRETIHARCHCRDCRAAYTLRDEPDPGAVDLVMAAQSRLTLKAGAENLRCYRNGPRAPLRWYAACCGAPLFLSTSTPRLAHLSVNADRLEGDLGPIRAAFFRPEKPTHQGLAAVIPHSLAKLLAENLQGAWKRSPLFQGGEPIAEPHVLSPEERRASLAALTV